MAKALILDEVYADALLLQGYREGLLQLGLNDLAILRGMDAVPTYQSYSSAPIQRLRGAALNNVTQRVLEMALLYDEISIPPFERFWRTGSENPELNFIASTIPRHRQAPPVDIPNLIREGHLRGMKALLYSRIFHDIGDQEPGSPKLSVAALDETISRLELLAREDPAICNELALYYKDFWYLEFWRSHLRRYGYDWATRGPFNDLGLSGEWTFFVPVTWITAIRLFMELSLSEQRVAPLFAYGLSSTPTQASARSDVAASLEAAQIAVRIYFKNVLVIPRVRSLGDVIRLRKDPRVQAYRAKIMAWASDLQQGRIAPEDISGREIQQANKELERLEDVRTARTFLVGMSIPLALMSLSGIPFGLPTAALGTALFLYERRQRKKFSWLLLGR